MAGHQKHKAPDMKHKMSKKEMEQMMAEKAKKSRRKR